jgi:hypothetical protein
MSAAGYAYGDVLQHRHFREVVMVIGYIAGFWTAVTLVESDADVCRDVGTVIFKPGDVRSMSPSVDYEEL